MTASGAPVFWEKVRTPDPRGLARLRLEERLLGPEAPPTGLVLGPPGSGKTTLLSWAAARATAPCAWYRADAEDRDEAALARHLAYAVHGVGVGGDALGGTGGWADGIDSVAGLVATLQAETTPLLVVLDDVHELAGLPAEQALERFVRLRPRHVRLLLGSRRPPAVNVSRLLVSGELVQLDAEDLRFRSWETEELFRAVYRQPLSPETAAALTRRTGGWAAGLQLFHLGSGGLGRVEREQAVAELSGRSRLIRSYLTRNVLSGLDARRRRFLLLTSALGVLTGEACDELLGDTGSAAVLDELEQQHFFTSSLDDGRTFRYHQVLQTHLEVVLSDELGEEAVRALHARSAALLERSGRVAAAVRAYARAADWTALARLLPSSPAPQLPDDVVGWSGVNLDDPGLLLAWARRLLANGQLPEAVDAYRRAEASMDDLDFRDRCAADRRVASTFTAVPPDLRGSAAGHAQRLAGELRGATTDLRGRKVWTTGLGRAVAALFAGDLAGCREDLALARHEPEAPPVQPLAVALLAELENALTDRRPPSLAALDDVVSAAETAGMPWVARLARGLQAAALLLRDPSVGHRAACADLLDDLDQRGDPWSRLLLGTAVGAAALLSGEEQTGVDALGRARVSATALDAPVLDAWLAVLLGPRPVPGASRVPTWEDSLRRARLLGIDVPAALEHGLRPWDATASAIVTGGDRVLLRTLGGFGVEVEGRELGWTSLRPRAQSVLMMLAAQHGRGVHRERLVDALWPDVAIGPGVRSLQVSVSSIRQCLAAAGLGDGALDRRGEAYVLRLPGCEDQCAAFEELAHQADRSAAAGRHADALDARMQALARYGGDLLPEAGPAEWVVGGRARLATLALRVATGAAELALRLDEVPVALVAATRAVELDAYSDVGWALLGAAHERNGDVTAAAVVRREHDRVSAELDPGRPRTPAAPPEPPARRRLSPPARTSREVRAPA